MSVLAERLKSEREKRGWTKKYVASKLLGVKGTSTYANYEYGIRDPDTDTLALLAQLYETSIDYLKGVTDDPAPLNNRGKTPIESEKLVNELVRKLGIDISKPGAKEILEDYLRMYVKHHQNNE